MARKALVGGVKKNLSSASYRIKLRLCNYLISNIICSPLNNWLPKNVYKGSRVANFILIFLTVSRPRFSILQSRGMSNNLKYFHIILGLKYIRFSFRIIATCAKFECFLLFGTRPGHP